MFWFVSIIHTCHVDDTCGESGGESGGGDTGDDDDTGGDDIVGGDDTDDDDTAAAGGGDDDTGTCNVARNSASTNRYLWTSHTSCRHWGHSSLPPFAFNNQPMMHSR